MDDSAAYVASSAESSVSSSEESSVVVYYYEAYVVSGESSVEGSVYVSGGLEDNVLSVASSV